MTLELINPSDLAVPQVYSHVAVATGRRLVFVAGQVAQDGQGDVVARGDLAGQARQAFANLGRALAGAGARPDQVTKTTIFVVHYQPEHRAILAEPRRAFFGEHRPASTLVGVEALASPDYLIEVEAIAVTD